MNEIEKDFIFEFFLILQHRHYTPRLRVPSWPTKLRCRDGLACKRGRIHSGGNNMDRRSKVRTSEWSFFKLIQLLRTRRQLCRRFFSTFVGFSLCNVWLSQFWELFLEICPRICRELRARPFRFKTDSKLFRC